MVRISTLTRTPIGVARLGVSKDLGLKAMLLADGAGEREF